MAQIVTLTMNPALDIATSIDRLVPDRKLRCDAPRYDPGGGGINVARAAHALGGDALAIFPAGGAAGELIAHLLRGEGVRYASVPIAGFTRESLNVVERESGRQYRLILPGPELDALDQQRCLDALATAAAGVSYLVASGSLPPGVPPDFYRRVATMAQHAGARLVLDTSGPALVGATAGVYLLKPSLNELESLVGHPILGERDEERAAQALVEHGHCEVAVVSLGDRGAILASAGAVERLATVPVAAKTAVGAGDSMLAGILVALTQGRALKEAVRYGIAAGAAAALAFGTRLCRPEDVERIYHRLPGAP